ncbi:MAG: hypothetical protein ACTSR0_03200 [Candidatus Asgardarchaeia archaeon]
MNKNLRRGILSILSGIVFLILGLGGSIGNIRGLIVLVVENGVIPEEVALLLLTVLGILSYMGGATMILGGILHIVGAPPLIANFLISIGSGASVLNLIINLILTAPAIKARIISMLLLELLDASTPFLLSVLAMLLVYLSIVDDIRGFIMMVLAGILTNLSGAMVDMKILGILFLRIGLDIPPQLMAVLPFLFYSGIFFFLSSASYGYGFRKLGLTFAYLGICLFTIPFSIMLIEVVIGITPILRIFIGGLGYFTAIYFVSIEGGA